MTTQMLRNFLKLESAGGLLLIGAMLCAFISANSLLAGVYERFLAMPVALQFGALSVDKPLLLWINDGLMAIFFLLVGLEVKREVLEGELSRLSQVALPGLAAIGGMVVPAALYVLFNRANAEALSGWAIPAATDIAFALGIMALLGRRVPQSLKLFLLTLAILDDLGAIVVIALFYTADLSWVSLLLAVLAVAGLFILNRRGVTRLAPYLVIGALLWLCVLKSGVHATLAGVVLAFAIPLRTARVEDSPARHLEHVLHPWVAFAILPLFAFANAGVSLAGLSPGDVLAPIPLGITAGLLLGKPLGIIGCAGLGIAMGWAKLPGDVRWGEFIGMACLCGVGFTMSLFITTLALPVAAIDAARLGVLLGSLVSALVGYGVLRMTTRRRLTYAEAARSLQPSGSSSLVS